MLKWLSWSVFALLFAGLYLQEFCGRTERLPTCLQPLGRRIDKVVMPRLDTVEGKLPAWARKLVETAKSGEKAGAASARCAVGEEAPTRLIVFSDGQELLRQLRCVAVGQKIELREVPSTKGSREIGPPCWNKAACAAFMAKKNKECEELNIQLDKEFARIRGEK